MRRTASRDGLTGLLRKSVRKSGNPFEEFSMPALSRGRWLLLALCAALLCLATPAAAQLSPAPVFRLGDLTVSAPWTRATPGGARVAGGYLKVTNAGAASDRLIGGTAAIAGRVEVHEMSLSEGVMRMRPLAGGLEIKPGASVELKPGGYHVMFMDLTQRLTEGDTVTATLRFEKAGTIEVKFRVGGIGEGSAAAGARKP